MRAVWTFLHAEGLSFKKTILPAEQDRLDIARKRMSWKAHQGKIDASRLIFINETWIKTHMAPLRGEGPSGQRLQASAPFSHWKTVTFIEALRHDQINAPWVIDRPINGELQSRQPQGPPVMPSTRPERICTSCPLQSRSQSDRTGRCKAQTSDASLRAAQCRGNMAQGRRTP